MNCPTCSRDVPPGSVVCPFCSQRILSGDPLGAAVVPPPPKEGSTAFRVLAAISALLSTILVVFLSAVVARRTYGSITSEASGYFIGRIIGAFLFPAIGVLLYKKFSKQRHSSVGLLAACCGFAFVFAVLATMSEFGKPAKFDTGNIEKRIGALAKEGTGQVPSSGNQTEFDPILRPFFADIKKFNNDYMSEVNRLEADAPGVLYSAESFNGDENIARQLKHLRATQDVEVKYASMDSLLQKMKDRLFASDLSEKEKQDFWDGFQGSFKKSLEPRDQVNASEQVWLNDSIALYEFMQANEKSFHIKSRKIIFSSDAILKDYNERIDKVEKERKEFLEEKEKFNAAQKQGLGKLGLQPSDFGAPEHK